MSESSAAASAVSLTRIVTVYQQWKDVGRWIHEPSLQQSHVSWILVNDAPWDPCPAEIAERCAAAGVTILSPRFNLGRSEARNLAARHASSRWIEFIDGDDLPLPVAAPDLDHPAQVGLLHFPQSSYKLTGNTIERHRENSFEGSDYWMKQGVIRHLGPVSCRPCRLIYASDALEKSGGFDGRFDTCEDLHLLWKFDQLGIQVAIVERAKQLYRDDGQEGCDSPWISFYNARLFDYLGSRSGGAWPALLELRMKMLSRTLGRVLTAMLGLHRNDGVELPDSIRPGLLHASRVAVAAAPRMAWPRRCYEALKLLLPARGKSA